MECYIIRVKVEEDKINQNGIKDIPDQILSQTVTDSVATETSKTSVIQPTTQIGTNSQLNTSTDSQPDIFVGPNPANGTDSSSQNEGKVSR